MVENSIKAMAAANKKERQAVRSGRKSSKALATGRIKPVNVTIATRKITPYRKDYYE